VQPVLKFDDHSFWKGGDERKISKTIWENRVLQTYESVKNLKRISIGKSGTTWGNAPAFAERIFKEIAERKLDWKTLLNDFIQEDVCDYSFSPPDRRFGDSDFFLPDFNEKEDSVENLLFMIDTSGSMSDDAISEVYSEIKGAIEQFNGKIKGWLGFFDAIVTEPQPFEDEDEFKAIRIQGGGGTAFLPIFHYVRDHMKDKNITSIIILTDGYAPYPEEYERMDIPVLWIINNENVTPPWGMIARIPQKEKINF
jgi:predicted metal-dependent peptidase